MLLRDTRSFTSVFSRVLALELGKMWNLLALEMKVGIKESTKSVKILYVWDYKTFGPIKWINKDMFTKLYYNVLH